MLNCMCIYESGTRTMFVPVWSSGSAKAWHASLLKIQATVNEHCTGQCLSGLTVPHHTTCVH